MKRNRILGSVILGIVILLGVSIALIAGGMGSSEPRTVIFSSADAEKAYDGQPLTSTEWALAEGALMEGHTASVTVSGSITDTGSAENTLSAVILDQSGNDVSSEYSIGYRPGQLTVKPRNVAVKSIDTSKQYDGDALVAAAYEMVNGALLEGHTMTAEVVGERTEVGEAAIAVFVKIYDANGNDVTHNYNISKIEGSVIITPHEITVQSPDAEKVYDGEALVSSEPPTIIGGELLDGHEIRYNVTGTRTSAGVSDNTFGVTIVDTNNNDAVVTHNYKVNTVFGKLTVHKRHITVRTEYAEKLYDGTPLTAEIYDVLTANGLLEGHVFTADVTGSQTYVGESQNTINNMKITCEVDDGNGGTEEVDQTLNYEIEVQLGKLVVFPSDYTGPDDEGEDPSALDKSGNISVGLNDPDKKIVVGKLLAPMSGRVYLRADTYGDYSGQGWGQPPLYTGLISDKYGMMYLTGLTLRAHGYQSYEMSIVAYSSDYLLPYYLDTDNNRYTVQTGDGSYVGNGMEGYSVYYYPFDPATEQGTITAIPEEYRQTELEYRSFVRQNYLDIPETTRDFMLTVISERGFSTSDPQVITKVASYVQSAATYNLDYDRALDYEEDIAVAFLSEYREGICQHYATAATLLYRALGIPARYTTGFSPDAVKGEWVDITSQTAHAWVEVYVYGVGWMCVEVTGGSVADDEQMPIDIKITSNSASKQYDGTPLTDSGYDIVGGLMHGHVEQVTVTGSQTEEGESPNYFTVVIIDTATGEDVTDMYLIEKIEGTLSVGKEQIVVSSEPAEKYYDKLPLEWHEYDIVDGALLEGHEIYVVEFTGSQTEEGTSDNLFTIKIKDTATGEDVTYMYSVIYDYGTLTVRKHELSVQSHGATKLYDGTPLTAEGYDVVGGALLEGHEIYDATYTGSQTERGTSGNLFTVKIKDTATGEDVTDYYRIEYEYGKLTVTTLEITVESLDAEKEYDGTPLTKEEYEILSGALLEGHEILAQYTGAQTELGSSDNEFTVIIKDAEGTDVTAMYTVSYEYGTLTVTERRITVRSDDAEKYYDGEPLVAHSCKITAGSLVDGHEIVAEYEGEQTEVGSSPNYFSIKIVNKATDADVSSYYDIDYLEGTLEVKQIEISVLSSDGDKIYDGTPLTKEECHIVFGELLEGHEIVAQYTGAQTEIGSSYNYFTVTVEDAEGNDVSYMYSISCDFGLLTVNRIPLTVKSNGGEKLYDGTPLTAEGGYAVNPDALLDGHEVVVTCNGSQTDIGVSDNTFEVDVVDEHGNSVLDYYVTTKEYGELTVTGMIIEIQSGSAQRPYDGTPLTKHTYTQISGSLGEYGLSFDWTGEQTEIGRSDNTFTARVVDENGNPVNGYQVMATYGTLEVTRIPITITSNSATKVYDGDWLESHGYTGSGGSLLDGHEIVDSYTGRQLEIGYSKNTFTVDIIDENGRSVMDLYYDVSLYEGTLTVTGITVKVKSDSAEKEYDGTPLTKWSCEYDKSLLPEGYELVISYTGEQIAIGESPNTFTAYVADENGEPAKGYIVDAEYGILSVTKIAITVKSDDAEKEYDGTPLTKDGCTLTEGTLLEGHEIVAQYTGSQTEIGSSDNRFTVRIVDKNNSDADVTELYDISKQLGTLKVTGREITLLSDSATKEYDGTPLTKEGYTRTRGTLKQGHEIRVSFNASIVEPGQVDNLFEAWVVDAEGNPVSGYVIKLEYGTLTVTGKFIKVLSDSAEKYYDGTPLTKEGYGIVGGGLLDGHEIVAEYKGEQTEVGSSPNRFSVKIVDKNNSDADVSYLYDIYCAEGTLTVRKQSLKITANSDAREYDGTPLTNGGYSVDGAVRSGHTLTVEAVGSQTEIGESENSITYTLTDSEGNDVSHLYDIECVSGILKVTKRKITIQSNSAEKYYDGTPLTAEGCTVISGALLDGHLIADEGRYTGSQTEEGSSPNTFTVDIVDGEGNFVMDAYYEVTLTEGTLTVKKIKLIITSHSQLKEYDGTPLVRDEYYTNIELIEGHRLTVVFEDNSITRVGERDNLFTYELVDENGNTPSCYDITVKYGRLEVVKRFIELESDSAEKLYDGVELTAEHFEDVHKKLLDGHKIVAVFEEGQTEIGSKENRFTVDIISLADNTSIIDQYDVNYIYGTLTVKENIIRITSNSNEKEYDGTVLADGGYNVIGELVDGHILNVTVTGAQTLIGKSDNIFTYTLTDSEGNDVSELYSITVLYGKLTVKPISLTVSSNSAEKVYDGTPLTDSGWSQSRELLEGHIISVTVQGSQTEIGKSSNDFICEITDSEGNDVSAFYDVRANVGTLWVYAGALKFTTPDLSKPYDGTPLYGSGCETEGEVLPNHELVITHTGEQTEVGSSPNSITVKIVDKATNEDVTGNYLIEIECGSLTVTENNGGGGGGNGGGGDGDEIDVFEIYSNLTASVYLRQRSFGIYTLGAGSNWSMASPYGELIDGKYSADYLTGILLDELLYKEMMLTVRPLTNFFYALPTYISTSEGTVRVQTDDTVFADPAVSGEFTVYAYDYNVLRDKKPVAIHSTYADFERNYREHVYSTYLQIPKTTYDFMRSIIENDERFDANAEDMIKEVSDYIRGAVKYNLEYNTELDEQEDVAVAFLSEDYDGGICVHYATAATMMFRALGIPARYVEGITVEAKEGEWVTVTTPGHAWTEVYIDGVGWITVEVTGGSGAPGGGDNGGDVPDDGDELKKLTVKPKDVSKLYDGNPLYAENVLTGEGLDELLANGYTYEATVFGVLYEVGEGYSTVQSLRIFKDGIEVTEEFDITLEKGHMQIYVTEITVKSESHKKVYDGLPLIPDRDGYSYQNLPDGLSISVVLTKELTNAGRILNDFTVTVINSDGIDVTNMFRIKKQPGTLTVERRAITIESASDHKEYDGKPLKSSKTWVTSEQDLCLNHYFEANVEGSQTEIGYCSNTIVSVVIYDDSGNDVTSNYSISFVDGTLEVFPPS